MKKKPDPVTNDWLRKHVYLSVKGLPIMWNHRDESTLREEGVQAYFSLAVSTKNLIAELTPWTLTQIFPVAKTYDGHKWECKDYFYTLDELNKIGMDNPIGDQVDGLLWDYQNRHIRRFLLFKLSVIDVLRRFQGQRSMIEEFMEEQGVTPMRMMTSENGKQFLYDPVKHTTIPVSKPKPRYLKVVK